jgi:AGZA family xanthine/uracil permease-like MFS transporter
MENINIRTEFKAALASFLATVYIIAVNPMILSKAGMPFEALVTATVLTTFIGTLLMGLLAKNPIIVAPGMGLNAFFTYAVVLGMGVSWQIALGAVFWSGIIFLILSVFKVREKIVDSIPISLRHALTVGIGLFISFIGFSNAGFIVDHPATLVTSAKMSPQIWTFIAGLFITAYLMIKKNPSAILLGIIITTIISIPLGRIYGATELVSYKGLFSAPDFSTFMKLDFMGSLKVSMIPVILSFVFTDLFDSVSTFIGVAEAGDLKDDKGNPRNVSKSLLADALATTISGLFGTSAATSYIESAVGVKQGGRTGLTAVFAAFMFLPLLFLSPLISMIPALATAPVLVIVGLLMTSSLKKIDWDDITEALPCFLAIMLIPLTYSISSGIIWGFLSYTFVNLALGKRYKLSPTLYLIDGFCLYHLLS